VGRSERIPGAVGGAVCHRVPEPFRYGALCYCILSHVAGLLATDGCWSPVLASGCPRFDSAAELAAANVSAFAATLLGLAVLYSSSSDALPGALPLAAALCWALYAIRCELEAPELISNCASYLQIGEIGRSALTLATGGSANVLACGAVVIAASRAVLRVWG